MLSKFYIGNALKYITLILCDLYYIKVIGI